jgi:nitrogenase molybdenum-iron protein alpha/beta subunit
LDKPFPIGFRESCEWVRSIGAYFHKGDDETGAIVTEYQKQYREGIDRIKPHLDGRRLMIIAYNQDIDWILQTAVDLGMKVAFVGILNFSQDNNFTTELTEHITELYVPYENTGRGADIARIKPDLLLTNYGSNDQDTSILTDTIPLCPTAGFLSGLLFANRWAELFKMNLKEGWRQDEVLYRKYCS